MQRGLLSAVLLSLSGGLLGCVLVLRRLALMGDALSHSLLPGIAAAWLLFGANTWRCLPAPSSPGFSPPSEALSAG